jgi:hypothetical protein
MLLCTVGVVSDENIKVKDPEGLAAEARQRKAEAAWSAPTSIRRASRKGVFCLLGMIDL